MRVVGVVPAAGYARRLGAIDRSKELLEVGGRPVMDYIIDRMARVHPQVIRVVTRAAKADVIERAQLLGLEVIIRESRSPTHSLAEGIADLHPTDIILIGFPDTIWGPASSYLDLLDRVTHGCDIALGLFESSEAARSDVVTVLPDGRVIGVLVKPGHPPSNTIWGCAVARCQALQGIEEFEQPGSFFNARCSELAVMGVHLTGQFVDVGTIKSLETARASRLIDE